MKHLATAFASVILLAPAAFAADDAWTSVEDAAKKRGSSVVFVVLVAPGDGPDAKRVGERLAEKASAKAVKDGLLAVRLEPADAEGAGKLGVPAGKKEKFFVLDGYGIVTAQQEAVPASSDGFLHLVKEAQDATAKKKKIEKALDAAVTKGEAAIKRGDTKGACEVLSPVAEHKDTIPCPAVTTALKHLEDLNQKGIDILMKARTAIGEEHYSEAQKLLGEAQNNYPLPDVQSEVKKVREELAQAQG